MSIFRYCIHAVFDNREIIVPVREAEPFLITRAMARWRALPVRRRFTEAGITEAITGAFDDAHDALRKASLRV